MSLLSQPHRLAYAGIRRLIVGASKPPKGAPMPRAFTLTEVLVVMVVILILTAILAPSLATSRAASQRTRCATNVRSLTYMFYQYTHDCNYLPNMPELYAHFEMEPLLCPRRPNPHYQLPMEWTHTNPVVDCNNFLRLPPQTPFITCANHAPPVTSYTIDAHTK